MYKYTAVWELRVNVYVTYVPRCTYVLKKSLSSSLRLPSLSLFLPPRLPSLPLSLSLSFSLTTYAYVYTTDPPDPSSPLPPLILRADKSKQPPATNGTDKSTTQTKQLIEVISSEQPSPAVDTASNGGGGAKEKGQLPTPAHSMLVKEPDGKYPGRRVVVKVTLPGVTAADQVDLEVSEVCT